MDRAVSNLDRTYYQTIIDAHNARSLMCCSVSKASAVKPTAVENRGEIRDFFDPAVIIRGAGAYTEFLIGGANLASR